MKNVFFLGLLGITVVILHNSCLNSDQNTEKKEINQKITNVVTKQLTKNSSRLVPTECGFIESLCKPCDQRLEPVPIFFPNPGNPNGGNPLELTFSESNSFSVIVKSEKYTLKPFPNMQNLEYYLLHKDDEILLVGENKKLSKIIKKGKIKRIEEFKLPNDMEIIFQSDFKKRIEKWKPTNKSDKRNIEINLKEFSIKDNIQLRAISLCKGMNKKTKDMFAEKLNEPEIVLTSASTWESLINPVFDNCLLSK